MTARAIMGLLAENATWQGDITFDGANLRTLPSDERRRLRGQSMAMIFQDPLSFLNPVLTVGGQIAEALYYRKGLPWAECRKEAMGLMDRVGIPLTKKRFHDYPHQFSGGMRQRAMIAMAIALKPKMLIADEPTTALDVTVQAQVLNLLMQLREEEGMALVLISHDLAVVAEVADTVAVMYAGRVVETGAIETVYREPAHPYTHGLLGAIPRIDQVGRTLTVMSGIPPVLTSVPSGCRFHPRCQYAQEICRRSEPALQLADNGTSSACHFSRASNWTKQR
jgi:oligopeptide transport system ATP-binding protein